MKQKEFDLNFKDIILEGLDKVKKYKMIYQNLFILMIILI